MRPPAACPRVYLAGPDLFFPDGAERYARLRARCTALGLTALEPDDGGAGAGFSGSDDELAQRIYEGNVALIREADGVLAHLCAFRGSEPDSGTVFEVGYAVAAGKPVVVWGVPQQSYADRVAAALPCERRADGRLVETASGIWVEGLGQRLNLMLSRSVELAPTADAALERLALLLGVGMS